jgi:hypothetical protein
MEYPFQNGVKKTMNNRSLRPAYLLPRGKLLTMNHLGIASNAKRASSFPHAARMMREDQRSYRLSPDVLATSTAYGETKARPNKRAALSVDVGMQTGCFVTLQNDADGRNSGELQRKSRERISGRCEERAQRQR